MNYAQLLAFGFYCRRFDPYGVDCVLNNLERREITAVQATRALKAVTRRAAWAY